MTVEKCACVFNSAEASAPMTAATMSDIASSTPKKGGGLFPVVHGSCGLHTADGAAAVSETRVTCASGRTVM